MEYAGYHGIRGCHVIQGGVMEYRGYHGIQGYDYRGIIEYMGYHGQQGLSGIQGYFGIWEHY